MWLREMEPALTHSATTTLATLKWIGEAQVVRPCWLRDGDADDLAVLGHQGAAGIAGIDGGVGLCFQLLNILSS